jgi:hypothetical protein
VFSDDIAPGAVHRGDLAAAAQPHALLLDDFGDGGYNERRPVGGVGKIQLTALCLADGETYFGLPGLDLFVQSHRAVQIGYAFHRSIEGGPSSPIEGETAAGAHGGEAEIIHTKAGPGGNGLLDGQIIVRDGDRTVTFVLHAATDHSTTTCHVTGMATRAAP